MSNYIDFFPEVITNGTYTIRMTDENNANNIVSAASTGSWSKCGRIVLIHGRVDLATTTNTSNAYINLPFEWSGTGVGYSVSYGWDCGSDYEGSGHFLFHAGKARIDNNSLGSLSLTQVRNEGSPFRFSMSYTTT